MSARVSRAFKSKVRLGRLGIPVWAVGVAVLIIAAVAGQTVGGTLSRSSSGSVGVVVAQSVSFDPDVNPTISGQSDGVAVVNNSEGTSVRVALESFIGQSVFICIPIQNSSTQSATAILEMNAPSGIRLEAEDFEEKDLAACGTQQGMAVGGIVKEARMDNSTWLLDLGATAGDGNNDGIRVKVTPADQPVSGLGFQIRLNQIGTNRSPAPTPTG